MSWRREYGDLKAEALPKSSILLNRIMFQDSISNGETTNIGMLVRRWSDQGPGRVHYNIAALPQDVSHAWPSGLIKVRFGRATQSCDVPSQYVHWEARQVAESGKLDI